MQGQHSSCNYPQDLLWQPFYQIIPYAWKVFLKRVESSERKSSDIVSLMRETAQCIWKFECTRYNTEFHPNLWYQCSNSRFCVYYKLSCQCINTWLLNPAGNSVFRDRPNNTNVIKPLLYNASISGVLWGQTDRHFMSIVWMAAFSVIFFTMITISDLL